MYIIHRNILEFDAVLLLRDPACFDAALYTATQKGTNYRYLCGHAMCTIRRPTQPTLTTTVTTTRTTTITSQVCGKKFNVRNPHRLS